MATTTKAASPKTLPTLSDKFKVEKVDHLEEPMRGRGVSEDTLAVRFELEASLQDREGRSFSDVTVDNKEDFARVVRAASKLKPIIPIATRHIKSKNKLVWGPAEVMRELQEKE